MDVVEIQNAVMALLADQGAVSIEELVTAIGCSLDDLNTAVQILKSKNAVDGDETLSLV